MSQPEQRPTLATGQASATGKLLFCWLLGVFLLGLYVRFTADKPPAKLDESMRLAERLALIAEYSPHVSPDMRAQLLGAARQAETNPTRSAVLAAKELEETALKSLSRGYLLMAQQRRSPDAEKKAELVSMARAAQDRLLICLGMLMTLLSCALAWAFFGRKEAVDEVRPMTSASPLKLLSVFLAWDVLNLFAVGPALLPLHRLLPTLLLIVLAQAAGYGLMLLLFKLARRGDGGPWNLNFPFPMGWVGRGYFACYALVFAVNLLVGSLRGEAPVSDNALLGMFMDASPGAVAALAILVVVVGPVFEELIFRGWLLGGLRQHWGEVPALLVSSALFALIHADLWATPALFALGCTFGWVYLRSGSLYASILLHSMWNATTFTFLLANMP